MSIAAKEVMKHPGKFVIRVLKAFKANQGLLLAGAVAYYSLLSIVPLLILAVIALSQWVGVEQLLGTLGMYLEWLLPGQGGAVVAELQRLVEHREVIGWVLLGTMLFFSSLAFTVLENAMSVIFHHRVVKRRRRFAISVLIPYLYILSLGIGLLLVTVVAGSIQAMGERTVTFMGKAWALDEFSFVMLYALGFAGEVFVLTSIYVVMPVGRLCLRHALVGGITAAVLWEATRHVLMWYFASLSRVGDVYGSLTTAIVVLLSLEVAATLLLLGAQVIAEFERLGHERMEAEPEPLRTEEVPVDAPEQEPLVAPDYAQGAPNGRESTG